MKQSRSSTQIKRGFESGSIKKKERVEVRNEINDQGVRRKIRGKRSSH